jgi:transposase
MQVPLSIVGVDVSKAELVVAIHGQDTVLSVPNECQRITQWLRTLPPGSLLAMESTGRYHQLLADLACAAGLRVFVLNARDVYFYAKAVGARSKTDRVDARIIARYLGDHHARLHPYRPPSATQAELAQLLGQRWTVVTKRTALRESLQRPGQAIAPSVGALDAAFAEVLRALDARITALIDAEAALRSARALLTTIVGVGPQSSALLVNLLSRVPFASADALVAYSGLDPRANDSGRSKGLRRLSKRGDPSLRHLMYMAASSASRTATFKPIYQALRARGLKTTEAMVVLARKLLRIAFAVWRSQQPFEPHRVSSGD